MNIKVKAGLEVAGFIVGASTVAILTRLGLDYLASIVGPEELARGLIFRVIVGLLVGMIGLLYDIRLGQLKSKQILKEMTKK